MPALKQLTCKVKNIGKLTACKEYYVAYGDGIVDCHCLIPDEQTDISITLKSQGYIAPGLAIYVYIDGVYQANRHRRNLRMPTSGESYNCAQVDFKLAQKERFLPDGTIIASNWTLYPLSERAGDPTDYASPFFPGEKDAGTIEVFVLRCEADNGHYASTEFGHAPVDDMLKLHNPVAPRQYNNMSNEGVDECAQAFYASQPNSAAQSQNFQNAAKVSMMTTRGIYKSDSKRFNDIVKKMEDGSYVDLPDQDSQGSAAPQYTPQTGSISPDSFLKLQIRLNEFYNATSTRDHRPSHISIPNGTFNYVRPTSTPGYIDTLDNPYAKFVFHYSDKKSLQVITGQTIVTDLDMIAEDTTTAFIGKDREEVLAALIEAEKRLRATSSGDVQKNEATVDWNVNRDGSFGRKADQSGADWHVDDNNQGTYQYTANDASKKYEDMFKTNKVQSSGRDENNNNTSMGQDTSTDQKQDGWANNDTLQSTAKIDTQKQTSSGQWGGDTNDTSNGAWGGADTTSHNTTSTADIEGPKKSVTRAEIFVTKSEIQEWKDVEDTECLMEPPSVDRAWFLQDLNNMTNAEIEQKLAEEMEGFKQHLKYKIKSMAQEKRKEKDGQTDFPQVSAVNDQLNQFTMDDAKPGDNSIFGTFGGESKADDGDQW